MTDKDPFYEFNCRMVRFKITDVIYECIIANLDREELSMEEIKGFIINDVGIETSIRELKYAIGLNALHSKKSD